MPSPATTATQPTPTPAIPAEPTLVIDKEADAEEITVTDGTADPAVVTWTLTYTPTNGPVHNAVITDEVPDGFTFLDASDPGEFADGTVTWAFAELTASGSVSFRTTVDVAAISRTEPTVNTAVIVSAETPEDDGEDSVTLTDAGELGGNPTPAPPDLPDTAALSTYVQVPATVVSLLLLASRPCCTCDSAGSASSLPARTNPAQRAGFVSCLAGVTSVPGPCCASATSSCAPHRTRPPRTG